MWKVAEVSGGSVNLRFGGEVVRDADAFSRLAERVDIHAWKGG